MEHQEREERLLSIGKLIRAMGHIKDFRNESLFPAIVHKVQTAYLDSMRLRNIVKIVNHMENNKERETPKEMFKRCAYICLKNHLIEKIEEAIKFLSSQSNLINTKSSVLSVLKDLDKATMIFKMKLRNYSVELPDEVTEEQSTTG